MHRGSPSPTYIPNLQNEVLHTPLISSLPRNILKAPPVNPSAGEGDQRYEGMVVPKPSGKLDVCPLVCDVKSRSPKRRIDIFQRWRLLREHMNKSLVQELKKSSED